MSIAHSRAPSAKHSPPNDGKRYGKMALKNSLDLSPTGASYSSLPRKLNEFSADENEPETKVYKPPVKYEGPIFEANRYLKRVTVTFRGLLRERLWQ